MTPTGLKNNNLFTEEELKMNNPQNSQEIKITKESVAQEIVDLASQLAETSTNIALRVQAKLEPIMLHTIENPTVMSVPVEQQRKYPPLFEELRNKLQITENSLFLIENAILRTEL